MSTIEQKYRVRLLNALLFFAAKLENPFKTSLCKMLWHLDYEHFKVTGLTVTNQRYVALMNGPVPQPFYGELWDRVLPDDFREYMRAEELPAGSSGRPTMKFVPLVEANLDVFSPRQRKLMMDLVEKYGKLGAGRLCDTTHETGDLWELTFNEADPDAENEIDFMRTPPEKLKVDLEFAREAMRSRKEMIEVFGNGPTIGCC
jgi:hypothetical protein